MTTVAWDGESVAADGRKMSGYYRVEDGFRKFHTGGIIMTMII